MNTRCHSLGPDPFILLSNLFLSGSSMRTFLYLGISRQLCNCGLCNSGGIFEVPAVQRTARCIRLRNRKDAPWKPLVSRDWRVAVRKALEAWNWSSDLMLLTHHNPPTNVWLGVITSYHPQKSQIPKNISMAAAVASPTFIPVSPPFSLLEQHRPGLKHLKRSNSSCCPWAITKEIASMPNTSHFNIKHGPFRSVSLKHHEASWRIEAGRPAFSPQRF